MTPAVSPRHSLGKPGQASCDFQEDGILYSLESSPVSLLDDTGGFTLGAQRHQTTLPRLLSWNVLFCFSAVVSGTESPYRKTPQ